jgi:hypothetical protein
MAKTTTKKTPTKEGGGSILKFFGKAGGGSHSNSTTTPDATRRRSTTSQVDVKPSLRKGKGRSYGDEGDPVVISDDEEVIFVEMQKSGVKRKRDSPERMMVKEEKREVEKEFVLPPPIASLPEFITPAAWPDIVNTANHGEEEQEEEEEQGELYNRDPDGDGSQLAVDDEEDMIEELPAQRVGDIPEHVQEDIPDVVGEDGEIQEVIAGDGVDVARSDEPPLDLGMIWDEGDDEGMGMEEDEEGDADGISEVLETPPLLPSGSTSGKGKMDKCPICGLSLKGKANTVSHSQSCSKSANCFRSLRNILIHALIIPLLRDSKHQRKHVQVQYPPSL